MRSLPLACFFIYNLSIWKWGEDNFLKNYDQNSHFLIDRKNVMRVYYIIYNIYMFYCGANGKCG